MIHDLCSRRSSSQRGNRVERKNGGSRVYADWAMMHLVRLDAWIGGEVTTMDTKVGQSGQRQTLFTILYGRTLRRAVGGISTVAWEVAKEFHAAGFRSCMGDREVKAVCENLERVSTVSSWIRYAVKLYLGVRKEYFLEHVKRRLGAISACSVASCGPDEKSFGMLE